MKTSSTAALTKGLAFASALAALLAVGGCSRQIGDDCRTSVDCDPNGTRSCDLSQPGGYCTIVGCDQMSCPSSSVCVRYFPEQYLSDAKNGSAKPCNVTCEDLPPCGDGGCTPDCPNGPEDKCAADELCLDVGLCARRSLETRACARSCSSDGDCRDGYECRPVSAGESIADGGAQGSMLLSKSPTFHTKFCAPRVN